MEESKKSSINTQLVLVLILAIFLVIFTLQNSESVSIRVFLWNLNVPVVLLILVCLLLGYLLPHFSYIPRIWRLKSELSKAKKEKELLEEKGKINPVIKPDPEGLSFDDLDQK